MIGIKVTQALTRYFIPSTTVGPNPFKNTLIEALFRRNVSTSYPVPDDQFTISKFNYRVTITDSDGAKTNFAGRDALIITGGEKEDKRVPLPIDKAPIDKAPTPKESLAHNGTAEIVVQRSRHTENNFGIRDLKVIK